MKRTYKHNFHFSSTKTLALENEWRKRIKNRVNGKTEHYGNQTVKRKHKHSFDISSTKAFVPENHCTKRNNKREYIDKQNTREITQ